MNPRPKASRAAIELIKGFEGFRPTSAQLADGRWTIGYGHTKTARQGVTISAADAEALLIYDLIEVQAAVDEAVFTPLTQNQFDALVAFAFNVGLENFHRSSVLRRVNEGNLVQAACALEMWRKADLDGERLVVDALVRRRAAEKSLFLTPDGGQWVPAPTPVVRPRVDYDVAYAIPRASTEIAALMDGEEATASPVDASAAPAVAAAVEAVTERLRALDIAEADAGIDLEPTAAPPPEDLEAPSEIVSEATEPPEDATPAEPASAAEAMEPDLAGEPLTEAPDASRRIVHHEAPAEVEDEAGPPLKLGEATLLVLGLVGLMVFAGSVFWGINARDSDGLFTPMLLATTLSVVGILMVASAVYFLLANLSGRDGRDD